MARWAAAGSPAWLDSDLTITTPAPARVINALTGGYHNFGVDRELANQMRQAWPGYVPVVRAQKVFAGQAVQWLTTRGVRQFLDIGCGLPVFGAMHDIAGPRARIVYADLDPVVVSLASCIMADHRTVAVVHGDLRRPDSILYHPTTQTHLDFSQPVAILLTGVLPHIADSDDPAAIIGQIRQAVVPGSYLALCHLARVATLRSEQNQVRRLYDRTPTPLYLRTRRQIDGLMADGWQPVEQGIVAATDWHPDPHRYPDPRTKDHLLGAVACAR